MKEENFKCDICKKPSISPYYKLKSETLFLKTPDKPVFQHHRLENTAISSSMDMFSTTRDVELTLEICGNCLFKIEAYISKIRKVE